MKSKDMLEPPSLLSRQIVIGNRIPKDYFVTKGTGESNITVHAGSYHLALKAAGIECYNIMTYSSILPGIAQEVQKPEQYTHGAVVESIMAVENTEHGKRATVGIMHGWLYHRETKEKYGGLVCEYHGSLPKREAVAQLMLSLDELYFNGFSEEYDIKGIHVMTESFIPKKKYGTAIVALCFTNYIYPMEAQQ